MRPLPLQRLLRRRRWLCSHSPPQSLCNPVRAPTPAGVPEGGMWIQESYCGVATWVVGVLICPWVVFCPFDSRMVYVVNGVRYNQFGAMMPEGPC